MSAGQPKNFDRSLDDVGNIIAVEHLNLRVPDAQMAALFYVTGLGLTRDPYIDLGPYGLWVNAGQQQFHLPRGEPQRLRGDIVVVVPSLDALERRLGFIAKGLADTQFGWGRETAHMALRCPWGNAFKAYECVDTAFAAGGLPPSSAGDNRMRLGLPYLDLQVPTGHSAGIARFYEQVFDCPVILPAAPGVALVKVGAEQYLRFTETDQPIAAYDGYHIAIYVAGFSKPHARLAEHGLITEESDAHQYRFQRIVDPFSGAALTELEHEVRSVAHPMYRRPLINRNAGNTVFSYRSGAEQFVPL